MQIGETFATSVQKRIEPVVKVSDRRSTVVRGELENLVVTPQWERYLHQVLDAYTDAADREDEQAIGIWISGFFGSGKSLLMKTLGVLLEGRDLEGSPAHEVFLGRIPASSSDRANLQRFLQICQRKLTTTAVGGNLHAQQSAGNDPLALIVFKLFADQRGYTHNWPLAWTVEYQIDARGLSEQFRQRASELCDTDWDDVRADPDFYIDQLYQAAAAAMPEHFAGGVATVDRAVNSSIQSGITPRMLVERLRRWAEVRDGGGRRHKVVLQLDELGQWVSGGNTTDRIMQVQALSETAAETGAGRVWIAVTAHGDIQALSQNVQQEQYKKITQRFALQARLTNDDISQVVEDRLLRKSQPARMVLEERFGARSGELADLGSVQKAQRVYPAPNAESFALFYPYMPWTVTSIPDVVKGIAQAVGQEEALTGSNRTMIGVVQGALIDTPGLLESPVGRLLSLADLYDQLASDVPIETKTDLNRILDSVPGATAFTSRVARALFLLGQAKYIPTILDNVVRALVDSVDVELGPLGSRVKAELERLVAAGYAKRVGEEYVFLSTQQRGFQDKVRARQEELVGQTWELIQALKEYESEDALRFDRVRLEGRDILLKLEIDGRTVRNPTATVPVRVYSPLQRALDPQINDDSVLKQRSSQEPDAVFLRMSDVAGLRAALAAALATSEIADQVTGANQSSGAEVEVARQAKQVDLASHRADVRRMLSEGVRGGTIFFRGTAYQLVPADSAGESVRATLSQLVPNIYSRFAEVPQRIANETTAIRAALSGNASNSDLQQLGVYKSDGTLNESHPLPSALRARLPISEQYQEAINAEALRSEFERSPFGWDGNCVKVGLALLLRESKCSLIDNGKPWTDPTAPEVLEMLTKEQRFKGLRVQGVRDALDMPMLQSIRNQMDAIFGIKPPLVPATLNSKLGEQLQEVVGQAQQLQTWAATAQCPLPLRFESGSSLVAELLNTATPAVRLPRFLEQAETLSQYMDTLQALTEFRRDQSSLYLTLRDFFNRVVNAEIDLPEVRRFIGDWRTVTAERSVTDSARWNELVQVYYSAQKAIDQQVTEWLQEAERRIEELASGLEQRVRDAGVPEEQVPACVAELDAHLEVVRNSLVQSSIGLPEARAVRAKLTNAELNIQQHLRNLRETYQPQQPVDHAICLRWRDVLGRDRIGSREELEDMLAVVRARILAELDQRRTVVLE
jgi:hypothetical protein